MSITLKTNQVKLKIQNGNYQAPVVIADQTTAKHVAEVNTAITTTGNQQVSAIQTKGDEVLDSIPEDYTDLVEDVGELKSAVNNIANNEPIAFFNETVSGIRAVAKEVNIPAGNYSFLCELTSSDTDYTDSLVSFYSGSTNVYNLVVERNTQTNAEINLPSDVTLIYFYAGRSYPGSIDDSFEYANTKITQSTKLSEELAKKLEIVSTEDIENGAVTVEKASFFETEYSANLFNPATMATDAAWAYTRQPDTGGTVEILSNQYTGSYTALKIPLHGNSNNVSIIRHSGTGGFIFSYYFTDENSSCISYEYNVYYSLATGKTINVPVGAKYLYITLQYAHDFATAMLMISETAEPIAYEDYEIFLTIPGLKLEGGDSGEWEHNATLSLPDKYELVVGDTFELFYQGIVKAAHWDDFDVEVTCAKGNAFERKFVYTPVAADIGNVVCTITLYDPYHKQMDSKTVILAVKAKASSPNTEKVVLYVGDSLTNGGHAPGEFKRRIVGSGGTPEGDELSNVTFIGTCSNGYVDYEGYGGWTWNSYNTANSTNAFMWITVASHDKTEAEDQHSIYQASNGTQWKLETIEPGRIKIIRTNGTAALPSSGTLTWVSGGTHQSDIVYSASTQAAGNPFWDESEGKVDFGAYATARGVSSIDYVYVLLGWNGSGTNEENTKAYVRTFINNVLASFPNCKIVLLGIQCPARDGLAMNYGASGILAHFYSAMSHMCNLNTWYADVASEYQNVSFVNVAGQFDTKYNMPSTSMQVNTRNTSMVSIQSNGVHPLTSGYYQIADACYRDFMHKLQE